MHGRLAGWIGAALIAAGLTAAAVRAADGPYAIVVSKGVAADNLSLTDVRRIFRLEQRFWIAGEQVVVLMPASATSTRDYMLRRLLHTNDTALRRLVLEKMYRGDIDLAPKVVASDAEAAAFAGSGRGVIALVPATQPLGPGAKFLRIDGHLPRDPGYPLVP